MCWILPEQDLLDGRRLIDPLTDRPCHFVWFHLLLFVVVCGCFGPNFIGTCSLMMSTHTYACTLAIHKLKGLYVTPHLLLFLYYSINLQPILLYHSTCFCNRLSVTNQAKLTCITRTDTRKIGLSTPNLTELNNRAITHIATSTEQDSTHSRNTLSLRAQVQDTEVQKGSPHRRSHSCHNNRPH